MNRTIWKYRRRQAVAAAMLALGASVVVGAVAGPASASAVHPAGVCQQPNPPDWCPTPPPPSPTVTVILNVASNQYNWGDEHQQISATLYKVYARSSGAVLNTYVTVTTHTWTVIALSGFHASSWVQLNPSSYATSPQRYGVTGTFFGMPDRTDTYTENVPIATALADSLTANPAGSINVEAVLD